VGGRKLCGVYVITSLRLCRSHGAGHQDLALQVMQVSVYQDSLYMLITLC
jgi:hypothetical protein